MDEQHFWGTRDKYEFPWSDDVIFAREMDRLAQDGVLGLPILVEALPILIHQVSVLDVRDAVEVLQLAHTSCLRKEAAQTRLRMGGY